jgi:hypothetical protein
MIGQAGATIPWTKIPRTSCTLAVVYHGQDLRHPETPVEHSLPPPVAYSYWQGPVLWRQGILPGRLVWTKAGGSHQVMLR